MTSKKKVLKQILAITLAFAIVITGMSISNWGFDSAWAEGIKTGDTEAAMTDTEAVTAVYNFFNGHGSQNPIEFPYGTGEGQYTNLKSYMDAKIAELAPGNNVTYTIAGKLAGTTSYTDYANGGAKVELKAMDDEYNITPVYADGISKPVLTGVVFTCGSEKKEKINTIYFSVDARERTENEILDFEASQLVFNYIKGKNASIDYVTQAIGVLSGSTVGKLPTSTLIYKTDYAIKWDANSVSGKKDALTINNNKVTIKRPEVGESNAVVNLVGTVYKKADPTKSKSVTLQVTVPAYKAVEVPVTVTPSDATLTIKSGNTALDSKYIKNNGNGNYVLTLHGTATDGTASYTYTATKEGYITTSGTIKADPSQEEIPTTNIQMVPSSADDCALKDIEITSPASGSASILTAMESFDKSTTAYTMQVTGPVASIKVNPVVATEGATVTLSYYAKAADVTKENVTTKEVTKGTACYLKSYDADTNGATVITMEVTAPSSSTQDTKTRTYTLTVTKNSETAHSLKALVISPVYENGGKNELSEPYTENTLSPALDANARASQYNYVVNSFCTSVKLKPTANVASDIKQITVGGNVTASGKDSSEISLNAGDNTIPVVVTKKDGSTETYNIHVYRKPEIGIKKITIDGVETAWDDVKTGTWTGVASYSYDVESLTVSFDIGDADYLYFDGEDTRYQSCESITLGTGDKYTKKIFICKEINGKTYAQKYVVTFNRMASSAPTSSDSYLPAPGQFVNLSEYYTSLNRTVTKPSSSCVTLGAFGGNVVYYFEDGITDDEKNPYGIDFIVYGNVFSNSDGSSASGAAEPAAVMVSEDGKTWYELAGSEYYSLNTERNVTVTYQNSDKTFSAATDVPWKLDTGLTGYVYKNSYHNQAYYPKSSTYSAYQKGVSANSTYTDSSVSFKGTLITNKEAAFGYADTHYYNPLSKTLATAVNPYRQNHLVDTNADGFDLAWAVNENGEPVSLSNVHYVKVYTAMLKDGGSTGEVSSEISGILKATPANNEVGETSGLKSLTINGETVTIKANEVVTYDAKAATSLKVTATGSDSDNIYVNNQRVTSGTETKVTLTDMVRIIVQNDKKEPVIYYIKVSGDNTPASNAELENVTLSPGDTQKEPNNDGALEFTVASNVERVAFTANAANQKASVKIDGVTYATGELSKTLAVATGENTFNISVTSQNGEKTKNYTVKVTREKAATSSNTIKVNFSLTGDSLHGTSGTHSAKTWIASTVVTVPKNSTVKYVTELMLNNNNIPFVTNGVYISSINGLAEFDNGENSGWMYRYNGKIADEGYAARKLQDGATVAWFYTDDYKKETGYEGNWDSVNSESSSVTTTGATGSATTTSPTDVKVTEKTNTDSTKEKVAEVTVSSANQKEILSQAKANKSKEIVLNVSSDSAKDVSKVDVKLDKSFINSIVSDTDAKLTLKTPLGDKTYTQDELKTLAAAATGTTVTLTVEKGDAQIDTEDGAASAEEIAEAQAAAKGAKAAARSVKTKKGSVKVTYKPNSKAKAFIQSMEDKGYTVKYRFYRSTKKSSGYKAMLTKNTKTYINTSGKAGTRYYYKTQIRVYDKTGKLIAKTALKDCKYATRVFGK